VTRSGFINPTPTQMLDGTQLYSGRGETTVTESSQPSHLRANAAAVCPATPAPSTTIRLITPPPAQPSVTAPADAAHQ
jgi:hypothetical protein